MRITAVCAGLGVAVGAALFVALRFVVGQNVLDGVGGDDNGLPRRYVDYLPTGSGSTHDLRAVAVLLGAGLVIGLCIGIVAKLVGPRRTAGAGRPLLATALAILGLVVGTLLAVLLHLYGGRTAGSGDFGWYSYSSLGMDGVFYGGGPTPSWWPLVLTGALVGLLVGAVAASGAAWTGRARRA